MPIIAVFLFFAADAFGKDVGLNGFNIQRFDPAANGYGIYNVEASKVLPHLKFNTGFYANFSHDSLDIYMPARNATLKGVDDNLLLDFYGAVGFAGFLEAAVLVPMTAYQTGNDFGDLKTYTTSAMGDMRFDLKFRALKDRQKRMGVALLSRVTVPTGDRYAFSGDDGPTWEGRLILDKRFDPVSVFANVGYRFLKSTKVLSTTYDDSLTFGGGFVVPLPLEEGSWSIKAEVTGESVVRDMSESLTPVEVRAGIRKLMKSGFAFDIGAGRGLTNALGSPSFRVMGGLSYSSAPLLQKRVRHAVSPPALSVDMKVPFAFDRSDVASREVSGLLDLAVVLAKDRKMSVVVEGHTDSVGHYKYNFKLSCARANAVKKILIEAGANEDQIKIVCSGEDKPISSNSTSAGRKENRRVEIYSPSP